MLVTSRWWRSDKNSSFIISVIYAIRKIFSILRPFANSATNLSKYLTCWVSGLVISSILNHKLLLLWGEHWGSVLLSWRRFQGSLSHQLIFAVYCHQIRSAMLSPDVILLLFCFTLNFCDIVRVYRWKSHFCNSLIVFGCYFHIISIFQNVLYVLLCFCNPLNFSWFL